MFVSYEFVFFLLVLLVLYYVIPKRFQWILLLIANFLFYCSAGSFYWVFILITSISIYLAGIIMGKYDEKYQLYLSKIKDGTLPKPSREEKKKVKKKINGKKKAWMIFFLLVNLGILAVLKYTNFIIDNVNAVYGGDGIANVDFILPMGISFYTFQAVGYLVDVYWNKCEPQKNFFKFTLFVSFFPQLIQGPISRYKDLSRTLWQEHAFDTTSGTNPYIC